MLRSVFNPKASQNTFWNPYTQTMPRKQLDELHLRKIQLLIKYAYEHNPFYRKLYDKAQFKPEDIRTWDDFYHKVPFTDKPDYVKDQEDNPFPVAGLPREYFFQYFQTTGTTGVPLKEVFSQYDAVRAAEGQIYGCWDCGLRPGDSVFLSFNFGKWVGIWTMYWAAMRLGCAVIAGGGMSTEDRVKEIIASKPTMVIATTTYLMHMAHVAKKLGYDLSEAKVKYINGGGEAGLGIPAFRKELVEAWGGAMAIDSYGISELGIVNNECRAHAMGVHLTEDGAHFFSVDPVTWERVGEGEVGENIVTSYNRLGQIFIKYRTHDLVERHDEFDHDCGWTWGFLPGGVLGRADHMISIRGTNVYPSAVQSLLSQVDGVSAYFELHITREEGHDRLLVKVEANEGVPVENYGGIAMSAERLYQSSIGVKLGVEVVAPNDLPRYELKTTRVFDHRPPAMKRSLDG